MKKIYIIFLIAVNIVLLISCRAKMTAVDKPEYDNAVLAAKSETSSDPDCISGGIGATECSIGAGVNFKGSVTTGCSISCRDGSYACCALRCYCKPVPTKEK